jgi:predicted nucleic acid-binding protein
MMKGKYVLCDSSSLISLTDSCLDSLLYFFRDNFHVKFIIPKSVEHEAVTRPLSLRTKIYCFSALRIKDMINDGVVEVTSENAQGETQELMELGNSIFYARGKPIRLIHLGETEMLAIAKKLQVNSLLMDERTTRVLVENPVSLAKHFEKEFHTNIMVNKKNLSSFTEKVGHMDVIRSTEMVYLASQKEFFKTFGDLSSQAAEAALYKLKYSGCAVSFRELEQYARMME